MFKYLFGKSYPRQHITIRRSDLRRIVNEAVDYATGIDPDVARRLRNSANTCDKVDYNAWQCEGSCGCPLTQIGVAHITEDDRNAGGVPIPREQGGGFYIKFDSLMSQACGGDGPTVATVID